MFFSDWQSLIRIFIISIAAYLALVFILRISGKRTLSKMNAFDLIVTIALGSTLATVILNKNVTLSEGVLAFTLLVFLQYIITYSSARSSRVSQLVKSAPTLMAYKGELLQKNMRSERIDEDEVWAALRKKGYSSLSETDAVVLETDGSLTVIKRITDPEAPAVKVLLKSAR
ncbi:DUF421 domain-containing protein [Adhaeribacter soli]|uniref:DUF421 domain-containing protein n=1 Tax=Adhaeribacter soli TaxID=2607655 RepID=A0A5N1INF5_9BACT|nr:DUF421 domain-containing protein [Adhaeribacter soli]